MVSMVTFLLLNGVELEASDEDIENIIVDVAEKKIDKKKLASWLKRYSRIHNFTDS